MSGTHWALLLQLAEKFVKVAGRGKFQANPRAIRRQSFENSSIGRKFLKYS